MRAPKDPSLLEQLAAAAGEPAAAFPAGRIVRPDCDVHIDADIRRRKGLPVIARDVPFPASHVVSLAYDGFMGGHALDHPAARRANGSASGPSCCTRPRGRPSTPREPVQVLPPTTRYCGDSTCTGGHVVLAGTGRPPRQW
ncbi:hypothetical protein [Streptomyces sp. HNM0574]|uniref:hypothetical protein n=1 Tax=Streptomyces sp. HNM0574 TaxID=2714954 RepID=UPI00146B6985|nr:hypothetical protein [Streptomyces sp. HNM0574]NLU68357.1 hypothetical protein [Streptomyces sp. HNM0574]